MQKISIAEGSVGYEGKRASRISAAGVKRKAYKSIFNNGSNKDVKTVHWTQQIVVIMLWATCFGLGLAAMDFIHSRSLISAATHLIDVWLWGLLVPLLFVADRRLPFSDDQLPFRVVAHLLMSIPFVTVHVAIQAVIEYQVKDITWSPFRSSEYTYFYFLGGVVSYVAVSGGIIAYRYYGRYQASQLHFLKMEKRFLEAHLHNLRMQLEPHFVANALNAISSEIDVNPRGARQLIENIGVLLRLSHEYKDRQLISLTEELAVLDHYLAIQKVRFGGRLGVSIKIAQSVKYAMVPSFLLQPLAENAVRHGLEPTLTKGIITISARRVGDHVQIRVLDNGVGLPPGWRLDETNSGQGLTITRERLAAIYHGRKVQLTIGSRRRRGTEVQVLIPYQEVG